MTNGAGNGVRTRDTKLGKLVLYQLSYARLGLQIICPTHKMRLQRIHLSRNII